MSTSAAAQPADGADTTLPVDETSTTPGIPPGTS